MAIDELPPRTTAVSSRVLLLGWPGLLIAGLASTLGIECSNSDEIGANNETTTAEVCKVAEDCSVGEECRAGVCVPGATTTWPTTTTWPSETSSQTNTQIDSSESTVGTSSQTNSQSDSGESSTGACSPGTRFCNNQSIYQCAADGSSSILIQTCGPNQLCNPTTAACDSQDCIPNAPMCEGNVATLCKSDGSGPQVGGSNCGAFGKICVDGQCNSTSCTPNAYSCLGAEIFQCASDGISLELVASCGPDQICIDGQATCIDEVCMPGSAVCDGMRATLCNASGTGFDPGGSDCAAIGRICANGVCSATFCEPNATFCQDGSVYQCAADGQSSRVRDTCTAVGFCDMATTSCTPKVCESGKPSCEQGRATVCNAEGSGFEPGGTQCAALGKHCMKGQCEKVIFAEDFEDGDLEGWMSMGSSHNFSVNSVVAAAGTSKSLFLENPSSMNGANQGLFHIFASPVRPKYVSYWVLPVVDGQAAFNTFSLAGANPPQGPNLFYVYFNEDNSILTWDGPDYLILQRSGPTQWYHFEFRDIDWTTRTSNLYINDKLMKEGLMFHDTKSSGIIRVDLFHSWPAAGRFDELIIQ